MTLECIDHGRVLIRIIHRERHESDLPTALSWQGAPRRDALLEHFVTFGVVTDVVDGGACQGELGATSVRYRRRETRHHPSHVLQVVPTRHLEHEGDRGI